MEIFQAGERIDCLDLAVIDEKTGLLMRMRALKGDVKRTGLSRQCCGKKKSCSRKDKGDAPTCCLLPIKPCSETDDRGPRGLSPKCHLDCCSCDRGIVAQDVDDLDNTLWFRDRAGALRYLDRKGRE